MDLQALLLRIPVLLYAITIHEWAHAWTASKCGDQTARSLGRVTLNPLVHLDPFGAICLMFGFFGWGKAVPVNPRNFRHPRRDDVLVSFAGPLSNFISAFVFGLLWQALQSYGNAVPEFFIPGLEALLPTAIIINLGLAFFNLIPLFPLDGSHILRGFLPRAKVGAFDRFSAQAPMILFGLILVENFTRVRILSPILGPPVLYFYHLFAGI